MAIIAEEFDFVVGVDTHARTHTCTAVHAPTDAVVDTAAFLTTSAGMNRAITWIRSRTGGERVFAAVEGKSSYGVRLTQALLAADIEVSARSGHPPAPRGHSPANRTRLTPKPQHVQSSGVLVIK